MVTRLQLPSDARIGGGFRTSLIYIFDDTGRIMVLLGFNNVLVDGLEREGEEFFR